MRQFQKKLAEVITSSRGDLQLIMLPMPSVHVGLPSAQLYSEIEDFRNGFDIGT
jgi:hypothetical protein